MHNTFAFFLGCWSDWIIKCYYGTNHWICSLIQFCDDLFLKFSFSSDMLFLDTLLWWCCSRLGVTLYIHFNLTNPSSDGILIHFCQCIKTSSTIFHVRFQAWLALVWLCPIHKLAARWNKHIKEFYWKLWYGGNAILPDTDIQETFVSSVVTIDADDIKQFCAALIDFAIVMEWKVCQILLIDLLI